MKYLVTGGAGYVGQHVVQALIDRGNEVVVVSRSAGALPDGATFLKLDVLESDEAIYELSGRPDVLIHLAWEDGFNHASYKHLENLPKHVTFLRNMLSAGLKHIVGVGTMHEIGYHVGPVFETTPTFPQHAYGIAKNHLRLVQSLLCREFHAIDHWIRCYYIYGDDVLNNSIFTKLLKAEAEGKTEFPLNTGELLYDFTPVDELGAMIADVAQQREISGIINCCSGEPISLKTMVLRFIAENKLKIEPVWGAFPLRPYDSRAIWGDTSKLNSLRARGSTSNILR
ncbi:NAD-dependent epimerase/dehydratase family protein [Phyllobacterium bourgognense]|uniref:dTDP-6-deoxy-L-talose 4-dehydrogenase (NAD+) n=1 Tax=Phyllobacterium bourgognense TaxID=314236 RepID=A0A368YIU9_9HYPH|nr:NAD(P)-dependent oxidoreductase [Phyllobacterium bourgognense]RCW80160.1 dTDP-6-deoxy-L-talose 4-dehydrogenase (NAD+) [Phyllobacterium bourgognense]